VLSSTGKTCTTSATTCTVSGLTNNVAVTFTVTARNADGLGAASASSNSVTPSSNTATITVTGSTLIGTGKNLSLSVTTGGTPKSTVTVSGLPAWMAFTPGTGNKGGTGKLAGVGPASGGVYTVTVHANNGSGPDSTQVVTVNVLAITSPAAVTFTKGTPGSFTVTTSGGAITGTVLSGVVSSHLSGLTFHDNGNGTATVSGTPTSKATSHGITVQATSGGVTVSQSLSVTIG
jgi:hypothetical protein